MVKKQVKPAKQSNKVDIHPVYGIFFIIIVTAIATTIVNFLFWNFLYQ